MIIETESEHLASALDTVSKTSPPVSGNVTILVNKKCSIMSASDMGRCTVVVPCESISGEEIEFAVPLMALRDAVKGRKKVKLELANSVLSIKSGSYKAELATVDSIPMDNIQEDPTHQWKVSSEQREWLKQTIKAVALRPTEILSNWIPLGVSSSANGSFVACYDEQHLSWVSSKSAKGDLSCVLPLDTFQSLVEVFKAGFTISQHKSSISVQDKLTHVIISVPSTDDIPSLEEVRLKVKEASSTKGESISVPKAFITDFMYNARSVTTKERAELVVSGEKDHTLFSVSTSNGKVQAKLKGPGKTSFKVDLTYFQEMVQKAGDEIVLNVVQGAFISVKLNGSNALVALNQ